MDEDDFDPSLSENELSKKHGVWGGGDPHLERELAKRIASPDERLGAAASDELNATFKGLARDV